MPTGPKRPFSGKYSLTREEGHGTTAYRLWHGGAPETHQEGQVVADLVTTEAKARDETYYPDDPARYANLDDVTHQANYAATTFPAHAHPEGHTDAWARFASRMPGYEDPTFGHGDYQAPLFVQQHSPKRNEVFLLSVDQHHRQMIPAMLGIAENRTRKRTGVGLQSSHNLSPYSFSMVHKLQEKTGQDLGKPPTPENTMDFGNSPAHAGRRTVTETEVGSEEVEAGRQTIRNMIRPKKKAPKAAPEKPPTLF